MIASRSSKGFSIIEVLIAMAILSVIAVTMMIFSHQMSSQIMRANLDTEADQVLASVQNLLNQTGDLHNPDPTKRFMACSSSIRGPGGSAAIWTLSPPGTRGPIGQIVVKSGAAGSKLVYGKNQLVTPNLRISDMYFREPDPTLFWSAATQVPEGAPTAIPNTFAGAPARAVAAKLVIEFDIPNSDTVAGPSGAKALRRIADVNVLVDQTDTIVGCYNNQPIAQTYRDCGDPATRYVEPGNDCPAPPLRDARIAKSYGVYMGLIPAGIRFVNARLPVRRA